MRYLVVALGLASAIWPARLMAEQRVLLIGVSEYAPEVTQLAGALNGPGNDVVLMAKVFGAAGVAASEVVVLSDRPDLSPTASLPTRANILGALEMLAQGASAGDRITIYFAGHGAQVPALLDSSETDGLDEVLLPADFRILPDGTFENMIRDDEIGGYIDTMIAAGADVWLIADACHSGSLRRSAGTQFTARFVDLRGDTSRQVSIDPPVDVTPQRARRAGQFVGFYAAAPGALAYEARPSGVDATHGLLTWALARALRSEVTQTYADLVRVMSAEFWRDATGLAAPEFSGALGAAHGLSGRSAGERVYEVALEGGIVVQAGRIDGVIPGTRLQIEDSNGAPLFEIVAQEVSLTQALSPVPNGPLAILDVRLQSEGLDAARFRSRWLADRSPGLVARVLDVPLEIGLRVGIATQDVGSDLRGEMEQIIARLAPAVQRDDDNPDFQIVAEANALFMRPSPAGAEIALSLPASLSSVPALKNLLRRAVKVRGLLSAAVALRKTPLSKKMSVDVSVSQGQANGAGGCKGSDTALRSKPQQLFPMRVFHCGTVTVEVRNMNPWPVDISPFYLAPDNQIFYLIGYEGFERGGWRIPANGQSTLDFTESTRQPDGTAIATGPMHVVLFAQRGQRGTDPVDFRYLQDAEPPAQTRSSGGQSLGSVLTQAGFGLVNRRSIEDTITTQSGAWVLPFWTQADDGGGWSEQTPR